MKINKLSLRDQIAAFGARRFQLRQDIKAELIDALPEKGFEIRYEDISGNDVWKVTPTEVHCGHTNFGCTYGLKEMSTSEMLTVLSCLAEAMPANREEALAYIAGILEAIGDEYQLCDPDSEIQELVAELPAELVFRRAPGLQKVVPYVLLYRPDGRGGQKISAEVLGLEHNDADRAIYVDLADFPDTALYALVLHIKSIEE